MGAYYYEIIMKFSCSQKRKCHETVQAYWKRQAELYDAWSDVALETDSQDSEDHSMCPQDLVRLALPQ